MQLYISGYIGNIFLRFLYSFFVQMPVTIWNRWFSLLIPSNKQFINYTSVSDDVLMDCWKKAQQELGTKPFPMDTAGGSLHPADPKALTLAPHHVTVIAVPDVPVSDLAKINPYWAGHKEPSGSILITNSGFLEYLPVYGMTCPWWRGPRVYGAASEIPNVLLWEFQNVILCELGYNCESR